MFLGTIEPEIRSMIREHVRAWDPRSVWVGCSGNFTVERSVADLVPELHGNDVSIYTCALGRYLTNEPVGLRLRPESKDELGWLEPYLDDGAGTIAVMLLGTRFLQFVGKDGPYFQRMLEGTRRQWDDMFIKTRDKIANVDLRLDSYMSMDVRDWLKDQVPDDQPVISFPPFFASGYETMWRPLETHFDWDEPAYDILDDAAIADVLHMITNRSRWLFASNHRWDDLEPNLIGVVQTSARRVPNYVYSSDAGSRLVRPVQKLEPVTAPRLSIGETIGDRIALTVLSGPQFNTLRSQYLNPNIRPGTANLAVGVLIDGRLVGAFAFLPPGPIDPEAAYLLSDFPVAPTDYPRLSKLVVLAATSAEARRLVQNSMSRRLTRIHTTAFSHHPVSMKYRGLMRLTSRKASSEPGFAHQLNYETDLGAHTLAEGLDQWKTRWGSRG